MSPLTSVVKPEPVSQAPRAGNVPPPAARQPQQQPRQQYLDLKANVHRKLLDRLNLEALAQAERGRVENEIRALINDLLNEEGIPISLSERETLFSELMDDVFGFGPLEPLLRD